MRDIAASILAKLKSRSRKQGIPLQQLLTLTTIINPFLPRRIYSKVVKITL